MKNKRDIISHRGTPIDGSNVVSRLSINLMVASLVFRRFSVNGFSLRRILFLGSSTSLDHNMSSRTLSAGQKCSNTWVFCFIAQFQVVYQLLYIFLVAQLSSKPFCSFSIFRKSRFLILLSIMLPNILSACDAKLRRRKWSALECRIYHNSITKILPSNVFIWTRFDHVFLTEVWKVEIGLCWILFCPVDSYFFAIFHSSLIW